MAEEAAASGLRFFLDRGLGSVVVPRALRAAGWSLETMDERCPSLPTASSASAVINVSCASISTDPQTVLTDLKTSDAAKQEAWVTRRHSGKPASPKG